jgi:HSP20 family molecular chaperone IbpA
MTKHFKGYTMKTKILIVAVTISSLFGASLLASSQYIPNLNDEYSYNKKMLTEYKSIIKKLETRNRYLAKVKKENPKLYVQKALYENKKNEYIYRVKLAGAKAKNLNFKIENHMASVQMALKTERNDKNGYYSSSQNFYQEFSIPKDVKEDKIVNKINGDYFEIIMPKK